MGGIRMGRCGGGGWRRWNSGVGGGIGVERV